MRHYYYYSNVKFSQPTIALPTNHNHDRVLLKLREVIIVYFAQLCLTRNAEVHWPIGEENYKRAYLKQAR